MSGGADDIEWLRARVDELDRNEVRLRAALDNSTDMVIFLEVGGEWAANNTVTRRLGYHPDYHPDHPVEVVHPDDRATAMAAFAEVLAGTWDEDRPLVVRLRHADGHFGHYEMRGRLVTVPDGPQAVVLTARDVNAELAARAEVRIQQAQRLESLHRLGAGVAHDFCNLVGAVANHLAVVEHHAELDDRGAESLAAARDALAIAGELSRRLLQFGDTTDQPTSTIDLVQIVGSIDAIVRRTLPSGIALVYRLPDHPVLVSASRGAWEQILLNLVLNAGEAISGSGTVAIELTSEGDDVECRVVDDGRGMPAQVRDRAFDPFFTTKAGTTASGLGLSTVFSFVRRAGGEVDIDSTPGAGTTVRIRWPRADR